MGKRRKLYVAVLSIDSGRCPIFFRIFFFTVKKKKTTDDFFFCPDKLNFGPII